jgi:F0F1-type ATP synthase alpha subunit
MAQLIKGEVVRHLMIKESESIIKAYIFIIIIRYTEVYELLTQIHQQEKQQKLLMLQICEKEARKMLSEVDDALKLEKKGVQYMLSYFILISCKQFTLICGLTLVLEKS